MGATATRPEAEQRIIRFFDSISDGPFAEVREQVGEAIYEAQRRLRYYPPDQAGPGYSGDLVWTNLRPAERERLFELLDGAREDSEEELTRRILAHIQAAALAFATEFPDAPLAEPAEAVA